MLKTVSSITNAIGALNYKGTWNASTNTPTLADGTGAKGDYYVVSTAGTQTFDGILLFFGAGDWIVYNGAVWQRVEGGSDGNFSNVTLNSTDAGATAGPLLDLYRNSASPAASDTIGEIEFNGQDSAGNKQQYALIHGSILSPTSGAEQGQLHFETATGGALTEKMIIGTTNLVINEIGAVFNVRIEGDTDANLFTTDATNSRVGVGTLSPAEKLDVVGNIKSSADLLVGANLLVGVTSAISSGSTIQNLGESRQVLTLKGDSFGSYTQGIWSATTTGDNSFTYFGTETSITVRGAITYNRTGGLTVYGTTSDYRAKDIIGPVLDSGAVIDSVPVYMGKMKGATQERPMFIAHETPAYAHTGVKDAVDADKNPVYQQMDASALIPVMWAEIQDLRKRLAILEAN